MRARRPKERFGGLFQQRHSVSARCAAGSVHLSVPKEARWPLKMRGGVFGTGPWSRVVANVQWSVSFTAQRGHRIDLRCSGRGNASGEQQRRVTCLRSSVRLPVFRNRRVRKRRSLRHRLSARPDAGNSYGAGGSESARWSGLVKQGKN